MGNKDVTLDMNRDLLSIGFHSRGETSSLAEASDPTNNPNTKFTILTIFAHFNESERKSSTDTLKKIWTV